MINESEGSINETWLVLNAESNKDNEGWENKLRMWSLGKAALTTGCQKKKKVQTKARDYVNNTPCQGTASMG